MKGWIVFMKSVLAISGTVTGFDPVSLVTYGLINRQDLPVILTFTSEYLTTGSGVSLDRQRTINSISQQGIILIKGVMLQEKEANSASSCNTGGDSFYVFGQFTSKQPINDGDKYDLRNYHFVSIYSFESRGGWIIVSNQLPAPFPSHLFANWQNI